MEPVQEVPETRYANNPGGDSMSLVRSSHKFTFTVPVSSASLNMGTVFTKEFEKNNTFNSPIFKTRTGRWVIHVNPHHYEYDHSKKVYDRYISIFIRKTNYGCGQVHVICNFQIVDEEGGIINEKSTGQQGLEFNRRVGFARFAAFDKDKHQNKLIIKIHFETMFTEPENIHPDEMFGDTNLDPTVEIICNNESLSLNKAQIKERLPNLFNLVPIDVDGKYRIPLPEDDVTIGLVAEFLKTGECDLASCNDNNSFMLTCQNLIRFADKYNLIPLKEYGMKKICDYVSFQNILETIISMMEFRKKCDVQLTTDGKQRLMKDLLEYHNRLIELGEFERLNAADMKTLFQFLYEK